MKTRYYIERLEKDRIALLTAAETPIFWENLQHAINIVDLLNQQKIQPDLHYQIKVDSYE